MIKLKDHDWTTGIWSDPLPPQGILAPQIPGCFPTRTLQNLTATYKSLTQPLKNTHRNNKLQGKYSLHPDIHKLKLPYTLRHLYQAVCPQTRWYMSNQCHGRGWIIKWNPTLTSPLNRLIIRIAGFYVLKFFIIMTPNACLTVYGSYSSWHKPSGPRDFMFFLPRSLLFYLWVRVMCRCFNVKARSVAFLDEHPYIRWKKIKWTVIKMNSIIDFKNSQQRTIQSTGQIAY